MVKFKERFKFTSAKKVLTKPEYKEYKEQRKVLSRHRFTQEVESQRQPVANIQSAERYNATRAGRFSKGFTRAVSTVSRRGGVSQALYRKSFIPRTTVHGVNTGKKGRPKGTVDKRYAQYGGVYGYRKVLNARLRQQRLQSQYQNTVSPQQRQVLNQYQQQQNYQNQNMENKIIPDTAGDVFLGDIMNDINNATNMVD